jgi:hypothetical protein
MSRLRTVAGGSTSLLAVLALASGGQAAPISFVSSQADLHVEAEVHCFEDPGGPYPCIGGATVTDSDGVQRSDVLSVDESVEAEAVLAAPPVSARSSASLQASVTGTSLVASSQGLSFFFEPGPSQGGGASSSILYELTFSVASNVPYEFHIELVADTVFGNAFSRVALEDVLGTPIFDVDWDPFTGEYLGVFDETGTLAPGVYRLIAEAANDTFDGSAQSTFAVTGTFIPEPATGALVAAGLLGVAAASRRRSRALVRR